MSGIINRYSNFVVDHPFVVLVVALILTGASFIWMMNVTTTDMDYSNMLPQDFPEIKALNTISDEFSNSGNSVSIVIETDPHYINSTEIRDLRDTMALEYMDLIENKVRKLDTVVSVSGFPDALKSANGGILPKSRSDTLSLTRNLSYDYDIARKQSLQQNPFNGIISNDYSLSVIRVGLSSLTTQQQAEFVSDMKDIVAETEVPAGLKVGLTGDIVVSQDVHNLIGPTMSQTSGLSLIGILVLVILLFLSVRYGLISLMAIAFGVVWVYGLIGVVGISLTSATAGSLSMIMGVGIDFGIQIVNRFRQELKLMKIEKAMKKTLNAVILPMSITTLAALIGFRAMSLGELTLLSDLGNIMALGILTCFLAAIMVIPPILIYSEKIKAWINK